jgi:thioesterase domain-containing protein/acyl carrier protein
LAARLMARVEDLFGVELPLAMLLDAPTVRGQAQLVREYIHKKTEASQAQGVAEIGVEASPDETNQAATSPGGNGESIHGVDEIENKLICVWKEVLKLTSIGLDDDFFDHGGHSVLATRLLMRIEDVLSVELPLASLLEASTIHRQAHLIRKVLGTQVKQSVEQSPLHQGAVAQLPFFFFGGDPTFRPLWQHLRELRRVENLGMQASILSKLKDPYSLECLAGHFVQVIRDRCHEGPYTLGGWCAHGLLAYETARQLREQGQGVALVVLLESAHPVKRLQFSRWKWPISRAHFKIHLLKFERAYLKQLDGAQARDYLAERSAKKLRRIKDALRAALKIGAAKNGNGTSEDPIDVLYTAAARYRPSAHDGKVVLVRCAQRTFGFAQQLDLGWSELLGNNLQIVESPGNHYTIYMPPNVDTLALKINVCLKRAEERAAESATGAH